MPPNTTYSGWGGQLHSPVILMTTILDGTLFKYYKDENHEKTHFNIHWLNLRK